MNQTPETDPVDLTIGQLEQLYRTLTGRDAPPTGENAYAAIPPEKSPEQHVEEQLDQLLLGLDRLASRTSGPSWVPRISVWESRSEVIVCVDVPGVPRESVSVRLIAPGLLEISGERPAHLEDGEQHDGFKLRHAEQARGRFRRLVPIAASVSSEQVNARMRDGELQVRMPRPEPHAQQDRTIQVD